MIFSKKKKWSVIENGIARLEAGDLTELKIVYTAFATADTKFIWQAGEAIWQQLHSLTDMQLLRLCERFRNFTSLEWTVDWAKVSLDRAEKELREEAYRYVLILGSFHPNGYFREKCIHSMADFKGMLFWLIFRVNDWVQPIRVKAGRIVERYLAACDGAELIASLPAFMRLKDCRRRTESQMQRLEEQIKKRLSLVLKEMDNKKIVILEPVVRASLYRIAAESGCWSMQKMKACLEQEKLSCLKRILIRRILVHPDCTLDLAECYLTDSSAQVRRIAVAFVYGHRKTCWPGLEQMLLDSSKGIRGYAAFILEHHSSLDIRKFYLDHLADDGFGYGILGLSEFSRHGNVQAFLTCLERPKRRIIKSALLALGSQEDFSDEELLWRYLLDDRNDISKAAYLSIRKKEFHPGSKKLYDAYRETEVEHQKRYLLELLLKENSWERLPYLLHLYRRDMPEQERNKILSGIRCRFMYGRVTQTLQAQILLALERNRDELPAEVEKAILYDLRFLVS